MLRVQLLGELQAEVGGAAVAAPASRRAWALLAWLALHPGEHARGAVAARFWPDVLDSSARASLRSALWELRRALADDDALTAGRDRIALRCETDLAEFDAHVAAGRLEAAVALHRGPLLADLDDDWVLEARDEHAERLGSALARLAAAAATPADAVGWARRRLALDPLDEDAARDLMRRLVEAGDRPGALAAYDRLSDRLRGALGLAPSAQTRSLAAAIREDGAAGPPRPDRPAPAVRVDGPALVGRDRDLAELTALWETVQAGSGGVAVIGGEAGIGKTRLALELVSRARAANARAARCTAADLGGAPPFAPWVELLAGLARELEPPPADARWPEELARLAPSLPLRLGRPRVEPAEVPADLARARLFEAAVELAEHATADRPLVLLFDDVHLADAPTLELAPISRGGSSTCRCCSCSRGAWSRGATRSTRSPMPRAAAASPCSSSRSSRSAAASSRRWSARSPRSPRRSASASSRPPTATRCSRSRAPAPRRAGTKARPRRCAARCARRSPGSTSPRAGRPSSPRSPAGRSIASSCRRWRRPRPCSRRWTAGCSAAPTGASASATTCCARPRWPTSTTPAACCCTRRWAARRACAPPRPRTTSASRAATTSRSPGWWRRPPTRRRPPRSSRRRRTSRRPSRCARTTRTCGCSWPRRSRSWGAARTRSRRSTPPCG